ncbi:hypothetical protein J4526_01785 [Desulfurococcaceae archaeon MEX13E-LK6-19]|nr:hypothetical protein J4526_01785 [Desulfurococcaceae archaeon MEX13E-LK6-19]
MTSSKIARTLALILVVFAIIIAPITPLAQTLEEEKIVVVKTYDLSDPTILSNLTTYTYDKVSNVLQAYDNTTTKIAVDGYLYLSDLNTSDNYVPAIAFDLQAPSLDLNNNEKILYGLLLSNILGSVAIGTVTVNETTGQVLNATFIKVEPYSDNIIVVRTASDVVIYTGIGKFSVPSGKVMIYTESEASIQGISEIELRSLATPPADYQLVRSGSGEATVTISATGTVRVYFDETHSTGDADLFIFDSNNPYFAEASEQWSWSTLLMRCNQFAFADGRPQFVTIEAHGQLKFVVKNYPGSYLGTQPQSWNIAIAVLSSSETPSPTFTIQNEQPSQTQTPSGVDWSRLASYFTGNQTAMTATIVIIIIIVMLLAVILLLRK